MSHPARFASDVVTPFRSTIFIGDHVRLDEARWSPELDAQVSACAPDAPSLVVMENGEAMLRTHRDGAAGSPAPSRGRSSVPDATAARPRALELCGVFQFEARTAARALASGSDAPPSSLAGMQPLDRRPVRISPNVLFRYYWRRHALDLRYPAPNEHVEEDAVTLLRHVASRARAASAADSRDSTPGRLRQRALARNAKALMAQAIADPHPIAQVARALDTSPFHLAHVFRTEVGSSPHQYLVKLRLIAAVIQLRAGAPDLSKLALELGFCHHSHFTAVFRQAIGYAPREVRRMLTADSIADLGIAVRRCS